MSAERKHALSANAGSFLNMDKPNKSVAVEYAPPVMIPSELFALLLAVEQSLEHITSGTGTNTVAQPTGNGVSRSLHAIISLAENAVKKVDGSRPITSRRTRRIPN